MLEDSDLIQGCLSQDRKVQEQLYNKFAPKMYGVCLRYSQNADDAQDILQDGFVKVFKNLEKFRNEGSFEGWLRRIFVNTSIEHFRKSSKMLSSHVETENLNIQDDSLGALDKLAERDIVKLLQELSPGYRQIFNMYVIEGFSHKDIAEQLGISEGTSKSQLARAKAILKKIVEEKLNESAKGYK
jgi:RNA polymerase sigma factor (sigma-70 family)